MTAASDLLKPYDARLMRSYPVSTWNNDVANDDEECARPVENQLRFGGGGKVGAGFGIAGGPLGAIAGTIPGLVIGGIIGYFGGSTVGEHISAEDQATEVCEKQ